MSTDRTAQEMQRRIGRRSLLRHSATSRQREGIMCLYVRRGCIEDEDVVATVHGSAVTLWRRTKGSRMPRQDDSTEVRDAQTSGW